MAEAANHLYLGRDVQYIGKPDVNEPGEVAWIELADLPSMIAGGSVVGAASVIGLMAARERVGARSLTMPRPGPGRRHPGSALERPEVSGEHLRVMLDPCRAKHARLVARADTGRRRPVHMAGLAQAPASRKAF